MGTMHVATDIVDRRARSISTYVVTVGQIKRSRRPPKDGSPGGKPERLALLGATGEKSSGLPAGVTLYIKGAGLEKRGLAQQPTCLRDG